MPLRDHFHSPVDDHNSWDSLHGQWPEMIVLELSKRLPTNFVAVPRVHLGNTFEIDIDAFDRDDQNGLEWSSGGGTATATSVTMELTLRVETDSFDVDEYEVRIYELGRGRRLVAAIERVSPTNKDRPESRQAFVAKCAGLLKQQVSVMIVDVVTIRDFNLYAELLALLGETDPSLTVPPTNIYAVACRGTIPRKRWLFEAWHRPMTVGQRLPTLPLWLTEDLNISLDLEPSYEETCRVLRVA